MLDEGEKMTAHWTDVCHVDDLDVERGVAALIDGEQVALFKLVDSCVHAVQHLDPVSGAHVLARGIVGSRAGRPTICSPVYKQVYDLQTGECLEALGASPQPLRCWPCRVAHGRVWVRIDDAELASPALGERHPVAS